MTNKILSISVMPDQSLLLEWSGTKEKISDKAVTLQNDIVDRHTRNSSTWLFFLGFHSPLRDLSPSVNFFICLSARFIREISRIPELETLRQNAEVELNLELNPFELVEILESVPLINGAEYINSEMLQQLWDQLNNSFSYLIENHEDSVESFFNSLNSNIHLAGRVFFHLVENKTGKLPFAFMATYSKGMGANGKPRHLPLKNALNQYGNDNKNLVKLLSTVHRAADRSPLIQGLIDTGELFHPLTWESDEAFQFLKEIPVYEDSGILCRIPDWWKQRSSGARLNLRVGDSKPSFTGLKAIMDFKPEIMLGELVVSEAEARKMLEESEGLAFIKNRWIPVDHEKLALALTAYEKAREMAENGVTFLDAMRMQLNPDKILQSDTGVDISVSSGEWIKGVMHNLKNPEMVSAVAPARGFRADLRPYQQKGLNWLSAMDSLNFGACLADDMGLGKTVQVLAFLSTLKKQSMRKQQLLCPPQSVSGISRSAGATTTEGNTVTPTAMDGPSNVSLLTVPASLISNWISEIHRFFPKLNYLIAHPDYAQPDRRTTTSKLQARKALEKTTLEDLKKFDLVITTYSLIQKYKWIQTCPWHYIILDEAQAIKNPSTKQTRSVKQLNSYNRIVMTGTPVENRISDLWSLFDFLNPGLLGNKTEFGKFSKSLKKEPQGYSRVRQLISPYILRRLKTDKKIISDLPEKIEMKTYAGLTKKQIVLYKNAVAELGDLIRNSTGIQRKGLVLSSLMKFKQLCNHPDQFAGTGEFMEKESGKFHRLREICETIRDKREQVLIFTQFKEMTAPLSTFLQSIFHRKGLVLHGSIPAGKRKNLIEQFQGDQYFPFMVLSLKAGGVGLNLTHANHVIHFDRWWNPAVENQATDRAFRIGQKKNVIVHKFITKGTIEEKIDQMLEDKSRMSAKVISESGESLITEMDNCDLMDLFKLSL